jgi:hypothetical protein
VNHPADGYGKVPHAQQEALPEIVEKTVPDAIHNRGQKCRLDGEFSSTDYGIPKRGTDKGNRFIILMPLKRASRRYKHGWKKDEWGGRILQTLAGGTLYRHSLTYPFS